MLPPLLERAGAGEGGGFITAVYTVLVEGDDEHDPIADAVRGILDGHIVLSRTMASRGQYPAVDVLGSLSRVADRVMSTDHAALATRYRRLLAVWRENEELVRLGAYRKGASAEVDEALDRYHAMMSWLQQSAQSRSSQLSTLEQLAEAVA